MSGYGPVVVTGASGMIGVPLVRRCLVDGAQVHVLTRSATPPARLVPLAGDAHIHHVEWENHAKLRETLRAIRPRTVFHLAGIRFASGSPSLEDYLTSAVSITGKLIEALGDLPEAATIFASSGAVYGDCVGAAESVPLEPCSWLGASKSMAEQLLATEARLHQRPHVTLRLFTPFGPDDAADRLVPAVIRSAAAGTPLDLTSGRQTRDYVYICDVVDAFIAAARLRPSQPAVFNIGSGQSRSVREVADTIFACFHRRELARYGMRPERPAEILAMRADISRAGRDLGWSPRVAFSEGIERTVAALARPKHTREDSRIPENMEAR